jgi:hypothetical protein
MASEASIDAALGSMHKKATSPEGARPTAKWPGSFEGRPVGTVLHRVLRSQGSVHDCRIVWPWALLRAPLAGLVEFTQRKHNPLPFHQPKLRGRVAT